jgi:hypothetical protein
MTRKSIVRPHGNGGASAPHAGARRRYRFFLAVTAGVISVFYSPAEARRIAIDGTNFTTTPGCTLSTVLNSACQGYMLPFQINFGSGLTDEIYFYEAQGESAFTLGGRAGSAQQPSFNLRIAFGGLESNNESSFGLVGSDAVLTAIGSGGAAPVTVVRFRDLSSSGTTGDFALIIDHSIDLVSGDSRRAYDLRLGTEAFQCAGLSCFIANGGAFIPSRTFEFRNAPAIPEPTTWAMMLVGFGAVGFSLRRQREGREPAADLRPA